MKRKTIRDHCRNIINLLIPLYSWVYRKITATKAQKNSDFFEKLVDVILYREIIQYSSLNGDQHAPTGISRLRHQAATYRQSG